MEISGQEGSIPTVARHIFMPAQCGYTIRVISQATYKPFYNYIDINLHSYVKSLHYVLFKT